MVNDDIVINQAKDKTNVNKASVTHEMNYAYLNFQWNDKIGTYLQEKYVHVENFTNDFRSKSDTFVQYIGVSYSATPKAIVTFELGQEIAKSADDRLISKGFSKPDLAFYLDYSI